MADIKKFVIVYKVGYSKSKMETVMAYANDESGALKTITSLYTEKDGSNKIYEVERVFAYNEYGQVEFYEMELKGFQTLLTKKSEAVKGEG